MTSTSPVTKENSNAAWQALVAHVDNVGLYGRGSQEKVEGAFTRDNLGRALALAVHEIATEGVLATKHGGKVQLNGTMSKGMEVVTGPLFTSLIQTAVLRTLQANPGILPEFRGPNDANLRPLANALGALAKEYISGREGTSWSASSEARTSRDALSALVSTLPSPAPTTTATVAVVQSGPATGVFLSTGIV